MVSSAWLWISIVALSPLHENPAIKRSKLNIKNLHWVYGSVLILAKKVHLQYCRDVIRDGCFSLICLQDQVEWNQNEVWYMLYGICYICCICYMYMVYVFIFILFFVIGTEKPLWGSGQYNYKRMYVCMYGRVLYTAVPQRSTMISLKEYC